MWQSLGYVNLLLWLSSQIVGTRRNSQPFRLGEFHLMLLQTKWEQVNSGQNCNGGVHSSSKMYTTNIIQFAKQVGIWA